MRRKCFLLRSFPWVGLLSILKRLLSKSLKLGAQEVNFYEFPDIDNIDAYKGVCRQALNAFPLDDDEAQAVVEEGQAAFEHSIALSNEVKGTLRAAA